MFSDGFIKTAAIRIQRKARFIAPRAKIDPQTTRDHPGASNLMVFAKALAQFGEVRPDRTIKSVRSLGLRK